MLLTLEKYPDGRPSLVRAGVGNIAVFGMSGSVHDRRPRNAPAGVICTRVPWSSHTIAQSRVLPVLDLPRRCWGATATSRRWPLGCPIL